MNVNFKGYNNIIANGIDFGNEYSAKFVIAQLDNEGEPDLKRFQDLKKMQGLSQAEIDNDVMKLIYTETPKNDMITLNGKTLYWGSELKYIKETLPKFMTKEEILREKT